MNLSIAKQIVIGFLVAPLLLGVIGGMSFYSLQSVNRSYSDLIRSDIQAALDTHVIQFDAAQQMNFLNAYFVVQESQYLQGFQRTNADLSELADKVKPMLAQPEDQAALAQITERNRSLQQSADKVVALLKTDPKQARAVVSQEVLPAGTEIKNQAKIIVDRQEEAMRHAYETNTARVASTQQLIVTASAAAIGIALVFGLIIASRVSKPLVMVNRQLKEIAEGEGDLTKQLAIRSGGEFQELASSFNHMVRHLQGLVRQVGAHAERFAAYAVQLSVRAEETSRASEHIAATVREVASGTETQNEAVGHSSEIIGMIALNARQTAAKSGDVFTAIQMTEEAALQGNQAIHTSMKQISLVHETISRMTEAVNRLDARSREIGTSIQLITDLSRQTNLLALNAGIESARAGEQGKGFAVVASEVRKLAMRSAESAQTITELIESARTEIQAAIEMTRRSAAEADSGLQTVNEAGASFDHIVLAIRGIRGQMEDVAAASSKMAEDSGHVAGSIGSIAAAASANAEGTQHIAGASSKQLDAMAEIAASAGHLLEMAQELQQSIHRFKV
ncbi:methyl-accepting chemotaxis protein [Paenibacillus elgii]|uniref:methyl-accepting chemotaxis protein n=1 Tax=Paenibacillus elgii TaxID=189691 RepID=UPI00203D3ECD|nr:methyl-accepting chemotaxis protein [Paenibacillus elgii]MCM3270588.1 methyl-accepting chemotaxis protein [Paenibacillus elgii]